MCSRAFWMLCELRYAREPGQLVLSLRLCLSNPAVPPLALFLLCWWILAVLWAPLLCRSQQSLPQGTPPTTLRSRGRSLSASGLTVGTPGTRPGTPLPPRRTQWSSGQGRSRKRMHRRQLGLRTATAPKQPRVYRQQLGRQLPLQPRVF